MKPELPQCRCVFVAVRVFLDMLVERQFRRDSGMLVLSFCVWEIRPASAVTSKRYMRSLLGIVRLCIGNFDGVATKEVPWIMFATA